MAYDREAKEGRVDGRLDNVVCSIDFCPTGRLDMPIYV